MSNSVRVPFGESQADTATLLLAAAEESKDFNVDAVTVSSYGGFLVPEELAKSAGVDYEDEGKAMGHVYSDEEIAAAEGDDISVDGYEAQEGASRPAESEPEQDTPAKKAPAKKAATKKAAAKKAPAKKAAAKKSGGK